MALIRQRNNRPFTFSSTPESEDAQYVRKELERLTKWFDQRLQAFETTDSSDTGIIPTSRGGFGADFSQAPTFSVPYTTQPGAFGWVVSSSFSLGLLRSSNSSEWRSALGVSGLESIPPNSVVSRYATSAGEAQFATLGAGLEFNSGQLKVSGALSQFSSLLANNNDVLQYKTGVWTNRSLSQYWTDLLADPTVSAYAYSALPFVLANNKRLLGRDAALPPFTASEISLGTSLDLTSGVLNTIQDIRTAATPTFAGLTSPIGLTTPSAAAFTTFTSSGTSPNFGPGGTGATILDLNLNGGSASAGGPYISFRRNGTAQVYVGTESAIIGNNSNALALYGGSNDVKVWAGGGGNIGTFTSTGLNNTAIGATTPNTGVFTTLKGNGTVQSDASAPFFELLEFGTTRGGIYYSGGQTILLGRSGVDVAIRPQGAASPNAATFTSTGIQGAIGATTPNTGRFTTLQTDAPSGGSSQTWKLGNYTAGVAAQAGKVRVEIAGVAYDLLTA